MNVSALARQLKVTTNELLEKLPELGFDIGARAIKVDDKLAPKITAAWKKAAKKEKFKTDLSKIEERGKEDEEVKDTSKVKELAIAETIVVKDLAEEMKLPVYTEDLFIEDKEFVLNKFGLSEEEFEDIMSLPIKSDKDYPSNTWIFENLSFFINAVKKFAKS